MAMTGLKNKAFAKVHINNIKDSVGTTAKRITKRASALERIAGSRADIISK